jgi:hypothetical protein
MRQQVIVTTDAPAALKPLLASAIQAELRLLELSLARITERLQAFEKQYGLTSEEFAQGFAAGEIGESLDYIEWAGEIETYRRLEGQWQALQKATLHLPCILPPSGRDALSQPACVLSSSMANAIVISCKLIMAPARVRKSMPKIPCIAKP